MHRAGAMAVKDKYDFVHISLRQYAKFPRTFNMVKLQRSHWTGAIERHQKVEEGIHRSMKRALRDVGLFCMSGGFQPYPTTPPARRDPFRIESC